MLLTVMNVGRVLDLYTREAPEWGPTEAGHSLALGKSKTHALMTSMAEIGLLRRVGGGRYRTGWRALQLEELVMGTTPFRAIAHDVAVRVSRHCGETVHVATLDAGQVVYVDRIRGARGVLPSLSGVGSTLPAHCSGVGKVLLAHLDAAGVDAVLDRHGLPGLTAITITNRDALYAELHRIRRDGVGSDREEVAAGLSCVAAPILDADGEIVAAMSISTTTERFGAAEDALRALVVGAAKTVTERLRARSSEIAGRSLPS